MSNEPRDVLRRLHDADAHFKYLDRIWRGGGAVSPAPRVSRAISAFRAVYRDASDLPHISRRHQTDRLFFKGWLKAAAKELGEQQLRQMRAIAWRLRWRYRGNRSRRDSTPPADSQLAGLARYLASWLVFTSDAPYAIISEISSSEQALPGIPDAQLSSRPPQEEPALVLQPGGRPMPDAGVTPQGLGPRPQPSPGQLAEWHPWSQQRRDERSLKLARSGFNGVTDYDLKRELLDESLTNGPVEGVGGHPILAIIRKFHPPSETPSATPGEFYQMLLKAKGKRNRDLKYIVDEAKNFLLNGAREFEAVLRDEDWTTIRPVVEAATRSFLAEHGMQNSQPLRNLANEFFFGPRERRWRTRDTISAVILGASLVISVATAGLASPLTVAIVAATVATIEIGAELIFTFEEDAQRQLINRAALIEEGLRVAERPEDLRLGGLTPKVALTALTFLLPTVVSRAARGFWRSGFTRRIIDRAGRDNLVPPSQPRPRRAITRAGGARGTEPASRHSQPSNRGTEARTGTGAPQRRQIVSRPEPEATLSQSQQSRQATRRRLQETPEEQPQSGDRGTRQPETEAQPTQVRQAARQTSRQRQSPQERQRRPDIPERHPEPAEPRDSRGTGNRVNRPPESEAPPSQTQQDFQPTSPEVPHGHLPDIRDRFRTTRRETTDRIYETTSGELGIPGQVQTHRNLTAQRGVSRGLGEDAGHRIGDRFGPPGGEENLAPQNWISNRYGTFKNMEDEWADKLLEGTRIHATVTDITRRGESRPFMRRAVWTETAPDGTVTRHERIFANPHTARSRQAQGLASTPISD